MLMHQKQKSENADTFIEDTQAFVWSKYSEIELYVEMVILCSAF